MPPRIFIAELRSPEIVPTVALATPAILWSTVPPKTLAIFPKTFNIGAAFFPSSIKLLPSGLSFAIAGPAAFPMAPKNFDAYGSAIFNPLAIPLIADAPIFAAFPTIGSI